MVGVVGDWLESEVEEEEVVVVVEVARMERNDGLLGVARWGEWEREEDMIRDGLSVINELEWWTRRAPEEKERRGKRGAVGGLLVTVGAWLMRL